MSFDPASLPAAPAYFCLTVCLVFLSSRLAPITDLRSFGGNPPAAFPASVPQWPEHEAGGRLTQTASLPVLAIFFLLPPGSLPPFFPTGLGMLFIFFFFGLVLFLLGASSRAAKQHVVRAAWYGMLPLGIAGFLAAWIAWERGFPGAVFSLGTFTAIPLWSVMEGTGRTGLLCLAAGLFLFTGTALPYMTGAPFAWTALRLASMQFLLVLLFPVLPSGLLPLEQAPLVFAVDFFGHWPTVFFLAHLVLPFAARHAHPVPAWILLYAGAALCLTDTVGQ